MRVLLLLWVVVLFVTVTNGCSKTSASDPNDTLTYTTTRPPNNQTTKALEGMVFIRGGTFTMGTDDGFAFEGPPHEVTVNSFYMDKYEITVGDFEKFVKATNYQTTSEKMGWSGVLAPVKGWNKVDGADWRHPDGPNSAAKPDEPVVHVSWDDAVAYAKWAKKRLPTEAEFEYALRGGLKDKRYGWGDELVPGGKYVANWWQGTFPEADQGKDGYVGIAPVGKFPPNGYGLYDITGNVWEWCADWFDENYYKQSPRENPKGPPNGKEKILRGGSWMCSENYCTGYRVAARNRTERDSGLNNLGFRCVRDAR